MASWLESVLRQLLATTDITADLNPGLIGAVFLVASLGELYIQIPLLMETVWLSVGYQSTQGGIALVNTALLFVAAAAGRQAVLNILYLVGGAVEKPLGRFYTRLTNRNKYIGRYLGGEDRRDARFLSTGVATLGMLTWLNGPIKFVLIAVRKRKTLLLAALFSSMIFDGIYILMGAVFKTTTLSLPFLPVLFLVGFLIFVIVRRLASRYTE